VSLAHRPPAVEPILRAAEALFRQHQDTRVALHSAEAKLEERAIIDQAKACLIRGRRLLEPDCLPLATGRFGACLRAQLTPPRASQWCTRFHPQSAAALLVGGVRARRASRRMRREGTMTTDHGDGVMRHRTVRTAKKHST
jgi:hypothetical protein